MRQPMRPQLATIGLIASTLVTLGVFLSGFVISEPAPYELFMVGLIGIWAVLGLRISRSVAPLLALYLAFNVGGMLSLTVMQDMAGGPMYVAVSLFLALSAVFFAAIIEAKPQRLQLIFRAWVASALITASLGILGYFNAFPGSEAFTLYDRAKGAFQDPNVFGPFLVAPALYLMHGLLANRLSQAPLNVAGLLVIALALFLSFSRAAWALFLFSACAMVFVMLLKERTGAFRLKILTLSIVAVGAMALALIVALQIPQVADLFSSRTQLVQDYDGGHLGRFARHRLGFLMSMEHPLGIGPMVFSTIFPEDEHNIWLKSLTSYGWLGFLSYLTLVVWTLWAGFRNLLLNRPWQPYLMIAYIAFIGHTAIGFVIDTDHWRHFYLIVGIVWGCFALEHRHRRQHLAVRRAP
ncbi:O-antigen ligase family protein [Rhizobium sp. TRM96647]|uniref:O-antigen ligase family protein n=1 Tax=unclassified Rhizobium TaxID=2613769 RepID=UPI0021E8D8E6|nr:MULTISPECIES: O-antigen ligase family protein [unclassified Rhizobium]MCV3738222.1 O-antigen ligase family protein [Rhizobium sp. TRM96647]MCV3760029.1 O-antigen ligase family protein [Rhizobium sp. TRM96650]